MIVLRHGVRLIHGFLVAAALRHSWTIAPIAVLGELVIGILSLVLPYYEVEVSVVETLICDTSKSTRCFFDGLTPPPTALLSHRKTHTINSLDETLFR